jgi:hypothetical protein
MILPIAEGIGRDMQIIKKSFTISHQSKRIIQIGFAQPERLYFSP